MIAFFDTSFLIPAAISAHPNHDAVTEIISDLSKKDQLQCLSTHVMAEMYSHISRAEKFYGLSISTGECIALIKRVIGHMQKVVLTEEDYHAAMELCNELDLRGPIIYDAIHWRAALKGNANVIFTENKKDFLRLTADVTGIEVRGI